MQVSNDPLFVVQSAPLARAQWRRFGQRAAHTRTLARRHLCGPDCGLGHIMPVDHRWAWKPLLTATPWASAHPDIVVVHTSVASNSLASGKPLKSGSSKEGDLAGWASAGAPRATETTPTHTHACSHHCATPRAQPRRETSRSGVRAKEIGDGDGDGGPAAPNSPISDGMPTPARRARLPTMRERVHCGMVCGGHPPDAAVGQDLPDLEPCVAGSCSASWLAGGDWPEKMVGGHHTEFSLSEGGPGIAVLFAASQVAMTEMQLRSCAEQLNVSRVTCLPAARRGETAGSYVAAFCHSALDVGIQVLYSFHGRSKHHAETRNPVKIRGRRVDETPELLYGPVLGYPAPPPTVSGFASCWPHQWEPRHGKGACPC